MENHVRLRVHRLNPQVDQAPYVQTYVVPVSEKMSVLQALESVYQNQDDTLVFRRYCCGIQYCNSCLMVINGKPSQACLTLVIAGTEVEVAPLRGKGVVRDLIVEEDER